MYFFKRNIQVPSFQNLPLVLPVNEYDNCLKLATTSGSEQLNCLMTVSTLILISTVISVSVRSHTGDSFSSEIVISTMADDFSLDTVSLT